MSIDPLEAALAAALLRGNYRLNYRAEDLFDNARLAALIQECRQSEDSSTVLALADEDLRRAIECAARGLPHDIEGLEETATALAMKVCVRRNDETIAAIKIRMAAPGQDQKYLKLELEAALQRRQQILKAWTTAWQGRPLQ